MQRTLSSLSSIREIENYPSLGIVCEWEDILSRELRIKINKDTVRKRNLFWKIERLGLTNIYHFLLRRHDLSLRFVMSAKDSNRCINNKNTIPVLIDFWLEEIQLQNFYEAYKHCPLVLVTSAEVHEFLKQHNCPLNVEHWPLSYPDYYRMKKEDDIQKKYEFCIFGRPNPFFIRLLDEYCKKHPDFTYISNNGDINHRLYIDHWGNIIAEDNGRQSYLDMIAKTKISCYTTPGIDEAKKESSRFNQVTPRLFELLTNGCSVIGHYPDNPDTRYYDLKSIVPNVNNYGEFENVLDLFRTKPIPRNKIMQYMDNHYTSTRVKQLFSILRKYDISIQNYCK